ncbi:hypothetical protein MAR_016665 [Mya arenaria]|uniref:Uncharacterized protein n=1 Tax=Mya arenaria TaxID=6604 RepID=A0ABY7ECN0_MYAAR|nr:hypothetical protein MAR_016665 [Mya arenaria]
MYKEGTGSIKIIWQWPVDGCEVTVFGVAVLRVSEQYNRRSNIRIVGVKYENARETGTITTTQIKALLKEKWMINIGHIDVDIAHRPPKKTKTNCDIIVNFQSRMLKDKILKSRKMLKNSS